MAWDKDIFVLSFKLQFQNKWAGDGHAELCSNPRTNSGNQANGGFKLCAATTSTPKLQQAGKRVRRELSQSSMLCPQSDIDYVYLYHSPLIRTCHMNLLDSKRSEFRGPQILDIWWASSCYFQPFDLWGHVTMFCYSELFIIGRKDKREERWERKKKENKQFRNLTTGKS